MELFAYTGGKPSDPARPAIVFIHGAQHDHSVWILQSRYLAHHGYGVLAFDLPGHGRSEGPACESVEACADAVAGELDARGVGHALLVGHSMGSLIALEVARRRPAVAGVALLATAFPMNVSDALLAATRDDPAAAIDMINLWSHSAGIAPFSAHPSNPGPGFNIMWQSLRLMQRIERAHGTQTLVRDFAACNAYSGGLTAAAALTCPVLFVLAEADQMTPPKAARGLVEAVTAPKEIVTLAATGHAMMSENPDGVREALRLFAQRTFATASV